MGPAGDVLSTSAMCVRTTGTVEYGGGVRAQSHGCCLCRDTRSWRRDVGRERERAGEARPERSKDDATMRTLWHRSCFSRSPIDHGSLLEQAAVV